MYRLDKRDNEDNQHKTKIRPNPFTANNLAQPRPAGQRGPWWKIYSILHGFYMDLHTIDTHGRNRNDIYKT